MKLRDFLNNANLIKDELLDKEIVMKAENGLLLTPVIKFIPKEIGNLSLDSDNIDKAIITFE